MPFLTCSFVIPVVCKIKNHWLFKICLTKNIKKHWKLGSQIICSISIIKLSTHVLFNHSLIQLKFVVLLINVRHCARPNISVLAPLPLRILTPSLLLTCSPFSLCSPQWYLWTNFNQPWKLYSKSQVT